jgi:chemotaxis protein CheD
MSLLPSGHAGADRVVGVADCGVAVWPVRSLSTYALGSCIAVTAYDWRTRTGGLLHVMLPDSAIDRSVSRGSMNPFMYVDTGLPELLRRMEVKGAPARRLRFSMAGGASMMAGSAAFEIGRRNHLALRQAFLKLGVFVDVEDIGGNESRSIRLDLESGRVDLRTAGGGSRVLVPASITGLTEGA